MLGVIDLNCIGSVNRWCHHWNVTRIELEIATRRVGVRPADVARELGFAGRLDPAVAAGVLHDAV